MHDSSWTAEDAIDLGRKVALQYREIVEGVFTRYIAGDTSIIEEVRANAASDAP